MSSKPADHGVPDSWSIRNGKVRWGLGFAKSLPLSSCLFLFLTACASVKPAPFQAFSQSIQQLKLGTDKALETTETMSANRFVREALKDPKRVQQLRLKMNQEDPLSIDPMSVPLFMKTVQFRDAVRRTISVVSMYADLLVRLSSPELLPREAFDKLASDLNANAFDAALSLGNKIPDPQNVALFSTIAVALTREYLESKRRSKLVEALTSNQGNIERFSQHLREAVTITTLHSVQEYQEESQDLLRNFTTLISAPEPDRRNVIQALIELDVKHMDQLGTLRSLHDAFGRLPGAHAELVRATENPDLNLFTIVALLEEGKRLEAVYDKSVAVNKGKAAQAIADRATALADKLDAEAETAQLRADRAQAEAERAKKLSDADPSDAKKKALAAELHQRAEKLKEEAENKRKKAAEARESALEAQKQADEIKKKLPS